MSEIIETLELPRFNRPPKRVPVVRCDCGAKVHCEDGWANECDRCGTEYNGSGQQLAPRSQWGEETGEVF